MSTIFTLLVQHLISDSEEQEKPPRCLLILDENSVTTDILTLPQKLNIETITNRIDIDNAAKEVGFVSHFSDFNFSELRGSFDVCVFRVAKERAINYHIVNQVQHILSPNGRLIVGGKKNEGIKNYYQKLTKQCGFLGALKKHKSDYIASLTSTKQPYHLDDNNYASLRKIDQFYSKPGVFGWNKIDSGSELLIETFLEKSSNAITKTAAIVDLGCGYGYLSLKLITAAQQGLLSFDSIHATDNNAAAVIATKQNLHEASTGMEITVEVSADDCGSKITNTFDLLVCNPPFHQGFEHDKGLSEKFISQASRLLKTGGIAYFVVNVFIPLENLAKSQFDKVNTLVNNGSFKVILAIK